MTLEVINLQSIAVSVPALKRESLPFSVNERFRVGSDIDVLVEGCCHSDEEPRDTMDELEVALILYAVSGWLIYCDC